MITDKTKLLEDIEAMRIKLASKVIFDVNLK